MTIAETLKLRGKIEGKLEARCEIAKKMLAQGYSKTIIYQLTGYEL